jgi:hypothetical protein
MIEFKIRNGGRKEELSPKEIERRIKLLEFDIKRLEFDLERINDPVVKKFAEERYEVIQRELELLRMAKSVCGGDGHEG